MKTNILMLLLVAFAWNPTARSEESRAENLVKANSKGKIAVSFDDELVKGGASLPDGDLIQNRLEARFKRFIKIRKDFIPDVENTKDDFSSR